MMLAILLLHLMTIVQASHASQPAATDEATVKYWVDDGCETENDRSQDDFQGSFIDELESIAAPRCCDGAGGCESPLKCGISSSVMDFAAAAAVCRDVYGIGWRLCSKSEILSQICCGTGGGCDSYPVWTSTKQVAMITTTIAPNSYPVWTSTKQVAKITTTIAPTTTATTIEETAGDNQTNDSIWTLVLLICGAFVGGLALAVAFVIRAGVRKAPIVVQGEVVDGDNNAVQPVVIASVVRAAADLEENNPTNFECNDVQPSAVDVQPQASLRDNFI